MSEAAFESESQSYRIVLVHRDGTRRLLLGDVTFDVATSVQATLLASRAWQDVIVEPLLPGEPPAWDRHFHEWLTGPTNTAGPLPRLTRAYVKS